eukprot:CAMPEP_0172363498 /NCGR_PEP_ID=MMETSP1060-20121228/6845_1 /TAXON_ID=37318 /ORGANISM="Pseudo-nitzschia pungens, Strain cf. cingulata" /LENGTH=682 /DNA_ID=CAMNT_0013086249 /DNA_START=262 /DNA_END=2310 /DNA_ORIENTATION=-
MADPFAFAAMPAPNAGAAASAYQQPPPQYQQQQQQQAPPQQQSLPQYQHQHQQQPQYHQQQQQYQQQQYQQPAPQAFDAAPPTPQQQHQQLVVATQPSNPYAGMVAPQPPQQQQQPQPTSWDIATSSANLNSSFVALPPTRASTATAASFDPFAVPVPAPAPPPQPQPLQQQQQQQQQQQAYPALAADPWAAASAARDPWAAAPQPMQQQQQQSYQDQPAYPPTPSYQEPQEHTQKSAYSHVSYEQNSTSHKSGGGRQSMGPPPPTSVTVHGGSNRNKGNDRSKAQNARNPYSNMLSQQVAGSNCSSLPKVELVGKRGFVLSRISFRTIVMKKWKQSFWIQYGGHTMLWFRSQGDFDDWLNNPYHSQSQRNFLIKLAINFVHDLYKPNVRGYQVTQCRTKPYGNNKAVRQFKLERWMDYGPTIAAAFGSYDAKEVDTCREAIVECMKNTPLDNGIRATGAVKEHHDRKQEEEWRKSQEERQLHFVRQKGATDGARNAAGGPPGRAYQNYTLGPGANGTGATRSNRAPSVDLFGNSNKGAMDESASVPPFFGDTGAGALVPAVNPHAAYPGAPPQQPAFYPSPTTGPPHQPQQQQSYPSPNGAPAPKGYPGQPQQQQPQQQHYPQHVPAPPAFAQQAQAPAFAQQAPAPAFAQPAGGYPQQQHQQQQPVGYPSASYPVPTHQY